MVYLLFWIMDLNHVFCGWMLLCTPFVPKECRFCYEFRQMFIQIHSKNDTLLRTEGVYCIMYEHANGSGLPVVGVRLLVDIVFHMAHSMCCRLTGSVYLCW